MKTIQELYKAIKQARHNENRQRVKREKGIKVRVRPEFWQQVQNDYYREIKERKV